jgi:4-amino-4-deoxy-L-arabinose transferase-like glycosyltransferase
MDMSILLQGFFVIAGGLVCYFVAAQTTDSKRARFIVALIGASAVALLWNTLFR